MKQENKVLEFLKNNINTLFDDFASAKNRKKRHSLLQNSDPNLYIARSIEQDKKSVFRILKRKKQIRCKMQIFDIDEKKNSVDLWTCEVYAENMT